MTICPQCKEWYEPELKPKATGDTRAIQDIYPDAEPWQTEQLITGLCSDKCFDVHISGHRPEYTYDKRGRRFENGVRKPFADPPRGR